MLPHTVPSTSENSKKHSTSLLDRMQAFSSSSSPSPSIQSGDRLLQSYADNSDHSKCIPPVLSSEDNPIDLTNTELMFELDNDDDYIPESLAAFVAAANNTLEETQREFLKVIKISETDEAEEDSELPVLSRQSSKDHVLHGKNFSQVDQSFRHILTFPDPLSSFTHTSGADIVGSEIMSNAVEDDSFISKSIEATVLSNEKRLASISVDSTPIGALQMANSSALDTSLQSLPAHQDEASVKLYVELTNEAFSLSPAHELAVTADLPAGSFLPVSECEALSLAESTTSERSRCKYVTVAAANAAVEVIHTMIPDEALNAVNPRNAFQPRSLISVSNEDYKKAPAAQSKNLQQKQQPQRTRAASPVYGFAPSPDQNPRFFATPQQIMVKNPTNNIASTTTEAFSFPDSSSLCWIQNTESKNHGQDNFDTQNKKVGIDRTDVSQRSLHTNAPIPVSGTSSALNVEKNGEQEKIHTQLCSRYSPSNECAEILDYSKEIACLDIESFKSNRIHQSTLSSMGGKSNKKSLAVLSEVLWSNQNNSITGTTPSPLSMSSPKFEIGANSTSKLASPATTVSSPTIETLPPPRFSPPSHQARSKAHFTLETAERLSRPTKLSNPVNQQSLPLKPSFVKGNSIVSERITSQQRMDSASQKVSQYDSTEAKKLHTITADLDSHPRLYRLSVGKSDRQEALSQKIRAASSMEPKVNSKSQKNQAALSPEMKATSVSAIKHVDSASKVSKRTYTSSSRRTNNVGILDATPDKGMLGCNPAHVEKSSCIANHAPQFTTDSLFRSVPPVELTSKVVERSSRPTEVRAIAMKSKLPDRGTQETKDLRHAPAQLSTQSHLLADTAVSNARKTPMRKKSRKDPPPKKVVSSASGHLMKNTASRQAAINERTIQTRDHTQDDRLQRQVQAIRHDLMTVSQQKNATSAGVSGSLKRHKQIQILDHGKGSQLHINLNGNNTTLRRMEKRTLTVPKTPKLSTGSRHGKGPSFSTCPIEPPLAQSAILFGKGLRDDISSMGSAGSRSKSSAKPYRKLTIPLAPNFATNSRMGLHHKELSKGDHNEISLAQSQGVLQKGLRSFDIDVAPHNAGSTRPVSSKFHHMTSQIRPASTDEKEEEKMKCNTTHPVRAEATSIGLSSRRSLGFMQPTQGSIARTRRDETSNPIMSDPVGSKTVAKPDYFSSTKKQETIRKQVCHSMSRTREEEQIPHSTFRARPVPRTTYHPQRIVPQTVAELVDPISSPLQITQRHKQRKDCRI